MSTARLKSQEDELANALRSPDVDFVSDVPLTDAQYEALRATIQAEARQHGADEAVARLARHAPASLLVYLVKTGSWRFDPKGGGLWGQVKQDLGGDQADARLRQQVPQLLNHFGLAMFPHMPGHRYVAPLLAHGGIPAALLPGFFEARLWPAVTKPRFAGARPEDLIAEWLATPTGVQTINRFFQFGGWRARRWLARCLDMAQANDPVRDRPSAGWGVGEHVERAFTAFVANPPTPRQTKPNGPRFVSPFVALELGGAGVVLQLPSQRLVGRPRSVTWTVILDGKRVSVAVENQANGEGVDTRSASVALLAPPRHISVDLMVDGDRQRDWNLNVTTAPFPWEAFGDDDRRLPSGLLPADGFWLLAPREAEVRSPDDPTMKLAPRAEGVLPPAWEDKVARYYAPPADTEKLVLAVGDVTVPLLLETDGPAREKASPPPLADRPLTWGIAGMTNGGLRLNLSSESLRLDLQTLEAAIASPVPPLLVVSLPVVDGQVEGGEAVLHIADRRDNLVQQLEPATRYAKAGRLAFNVGAVSDSLRTADMTGLQVVLVTTGNRREVARLTPSWNPTDFTARWAAGKLHLSWRETRKLSNRVVLLWDRWRPWEPARRIAIPDEASAGCTLPLDLSPARYRLRLTIDDPWSGSPLDLTLPVANAPGTIDMVVGDGELPELPPDDVLERAARFNALADQGQAPFSKIYNLEMHVKPSHVAPLLLTLVGEGDRPFAHTRAWLEWMGNMACWYRAHDVARAVITLEAQFGREVAQQVIEKLVGLGWYRRVGPFWVADDHPTGYDPEAKRSTHAPTEVEPLEAHDLKRLYDLDPAFALALEPTASDETEETSPETLLGDLLKAAIPPSQMSDRLAGWRGAGARARLMEYLGTTQGGSPEEALNANQPLGSVAEELQRPLEIYDRFTHQFPSKSLLDENASRRADMAWLRRVVESQAAKNRLASLCDEWARNLNNVLDDELKRASDGQRPRLAAAIADMRRRLPSRLFKEWQPGVPERTLSALPFVSGAFALVVRARAHRVEKADPASRPWIRADEMVVVPTGRTDHEGELDQAFATLYQLAPLRVRRDLVLAELALLPVAEPNDEEPET